jgi:hypothetical protein
MGGLISRKVNRATYPTRYNRFSCHVNEEHLAENGNESKYSVRHAGSLRRHNTAEVDIKQTERICIIIA